jgi:hypothetical protein
MSQLPANLATVFGFEVRLDALDESVDVAVRMAGCVFTR